MSEDGTATSTVKADTKDGSQSPTLLASMNRANSGFASPILTASPVPPTVTDTEATFTAERPGVHIKTARATSKGITYLSHPTVFLLSQKKRTVDEA